MIKRICWSVVPVFVAITCTPAHAYEVLAPGASFAGKSVAAWTSDWWSWAWNSPATADPLDDTSGALANQNNQGPVFFVAGSNQSGSIQRSFDVPAGKALLVPMINYWENCPGDVAISCAGYPLDPRPQMLANVPVLKAAVTNIFASIDNAPVSDPYTRWEVSDFFSGGIAKADSTITALYANALGYNIEGLPIEPSLSYGYYVMITGLSPGPHTLTFGGSTSAYGPFDYNVTANINVVSVPEPQSAAMLLLGLAAVCCSVLRKAR